MTQGCKAGQEPVNAKHFVCAVVSQTTAHRKQVAVDNVNVNQP